MSAILKALTSARLEKFGAAIAGASFVKPFAPGGQCSYGARFNEGKFDAMWFDADYFPLT